MDIKDKARILIGQLQGQPGQFVCNSDGRMLGFVPDNYKDHSSDCIVWGPKETIVLVILRDGTLQNPNGTPSTYTDPVAYLLNQAIQIIQPLDDEAGDDRDVTNDHDLFLVIGNAVSKIQSFECLLAGLLAILDNQKGRTTSYEELLAKHYTSTLGGLVKHFRDHINDPETANALAYARDRCNFLVHGLLRKYGWPVMSEADYRICALEILEIISAISHAEDQLVRYLNESETMSIARFEIGADVLQLTEDEMEKEIAKQLKPRNMAGKKPYRPNRKGISE